MVSRGYSVNKRVLLSNNLTSSLLALLEALSVFVDSILLRGCGACFHDVKWFTSASDIV